MNEASNGHLGHPHDLRDFAVLELLVVAEVDRGPLASREASHRLVDRPDALTPDDEIGERRGIVRAVDPEVGQVGKPAPLVVVDDEVVGDPEEPRPTNGRLVRRCTANDSPEDLANEILDVRVVPNSEGDIGADPCLVLDEELPGSGARVARARSIVFRAQDRLPSHHQTSLLGQDDAIPILLHELKCRRFCNGIARSSSTEIA